MVLVHGSGFSGSASANTWVPVLGSLGERFHVFAPDKLASGMTGNPEEDRDYSLEGEVRHMVQFIRTLGLDEIHLIGQDRGAHLVELGGDRVGQLERRIAAAEAGRQLR